MNFITRLKLAYKVFKMEPFNIVIPGYKEIGQVEQPECDGTWESYHQICKSGKPAKWCMSRLNLSFEIDHEGDHFHCCDGCKQLAIAGKVRHA